jgi:hypothetical protein
MGPGRIGGSFGRPSRGAKALARKKCAWCERFRARRQLGFFHAGDVACRPISTKRVAFVHWGRPGEPCCCPGWRRGRGEHKGAPVVRTMFRQADSRSGPVCSYPKQGSRHDGRPEAAPAEAWGAPRTCVSYRHRGRCDRPPWCGRYSGENADARNDRGNENGRGTACPGRRRRHASGSFVPPALSRPEARAVSGRVPTALVQHPGGAHGNAR